MEGRPDGIWAKVEWTPAAKAQIEAKEYRYISPVFATTPDGLVLRIMHASLTNNPNLELTAVASADVKQTTKQEKTMNANLLAIASALGLNEPKDEAEIVAHASTFMERFKTFEDVVNALRKQMNIDDKADVVATAAALVAGSKPDPTQFVPMSVHTQKRCARLMTMQSVTCDP